MKRFFHYFTLSILLFSCQKEYEKKPVKPTPKIKSITENGVKYDGPEKYSYYLASIKHGGDNVNSEPKFGRYLLIKFNGGAVSLYETSRTE